MGESKGVSELGRLRELASEGEKCGRASERERGKEQGMEKEKERVWEQEGVKEGERG